MSLKDISVVDEMVTYLVNQTWRLMDASLSLYFAMNLKKQAPKSLLKKIKTLAKEINEICEELP